MFTKDQSKIGYTPEIQAQPIRDMICRIKACVSNIRKSAIRMDPAVMSNCCRQARGHILTKL